LAYDGDVLVGNATIRPPDPGDGIATVIVRILPEHFAKAVQEQIRRRVSRTAS
jgi:hypothetical protein